MLFERLDHRTDIFPCTCLDLVPCPGVSYFGYAPGILIVFSDIYEPAHCMISFEPAQQSIVVGLRAVACVWRAYYRLSYERLECFFCSLFSYAPFILIENAIVDSEDLQEVLAVFLELLEPCVIGSPDSSFDLARDKTAVGIRIFFVRVLA